MYLANGSNFLCYTNTVGEAAGTVITFKASPVDGKLLIEFNNGARSFYSAGIGNSDAAGAGNTDESYRFTVEEVTSLPVTIGSVGFATLYAPVALNVPEGVTAYVGELGNDVLTLEEVETIPAETGVVLKGSDASYDFEITDEADDIEANALKGTIAAMAASTDKGTIYTLQGADAQPGVAFKKYIGDDNKVPNLKGFKAYLPVNTAASAISVRFGDEETTDIENPEIINHKSEMIYDLQGRRVLNPTKGTYIVNGRKVIVK